VWRWCDDDTSTPPRQAAIFLWRSFGCWGIRRRVVVGVLWRAVRMERKKKEEINDLSKHSYHEHDLS